MKASTYDSLNQMHQDLNAQKILQSGQTLINVSNRLPISFDKGLQKSSGGLVTAFEDIQNSENFTWLGWAGKFAVDKAEEASIAESLEAFNYHPVFLNQESINNYYDGFCNASLWPILHQFSTYYEFKYDWYVSYLEVNERFCEEVLAIAPQEAIVWIHDYHFFLLPQMLKQKRPDLKIGFFLHTPFPSYEIFRIHPKRRTLLKGLLGADLIGFHTYNYSRHFRSAVLRILGIDSEPTHIKNGERSTQIGVFPIGISWDHFQKNLKDPACVAAQARLQETYRGKRLVLSVERLDYTKGIPEKLNAIELFLEKNPHLISQLVFIQIAVPSRQNVKANQQLIQTIEARVSQINGRFGTVDHVPINFIFHSVNSTDLCALYSMAEVALVTPLMDGMNLVAKEFIACKANKPGILILSEFAGAVEELHHARLVNPYDAWQLSQVLAQALEGPVESSIRGNNEMIEIIKKQNSVFWAKSFLHELSQIEIKPLKHSQSHKVDTQSILDALSHKKKIILFLDYDGTLREFEDQAEWASPTAEIYKLLEALLAQNTLELCIISGRSQKDLDKWFAHLPVHLVAEHGFFIKEKAGDWCVLDSQLDLKWKDSLKPILQDFVFSSPGSRLEEKRSALVWHYRTCDPDFGDWKAKQLYAELHASAGGLPVKIQHSSKKIVELSSAYIHKGAAVQHLIANKDFDAVICVGDDLTDENMFELDLKDLISIKIGEGTTKAQYLLDSPAALRSLLKGWING